MNFKENSFIRKYIAITLGQDLLKGNTLIFVEATQDRR